MPITVPPKNISHSDWTPLKGVGAIVIFLLLSFGIWMIFIGSETTYKEEGSKNSRGATTTKSSMGVGGKIKQSPHETPLGVKPSTSVIAPVEQTSGSGLPLSFYNGSVSLMAGTAAKETYPEKEYIILNITLKNLSSLDLNDWTLQNSNGKTVRLGIGTPVSLGGEYAPYIRVKGGDKIIISTGDSPVAPWFRINKCSGYLEQFEDFIPEISTRCPHISSESSYQKLERVCQDFVRTIPSCTMPSNQYPTNMSVACKTFINETLGYNACVAKHKNNVDFYGGLYGDEWRVYLGQGDEMWKEKDETISLLDAVGKLVADVKY